MCSIREIIATVEASHGLPSGSIVGKCRERKVVQWRHYAMFLARRETGASYEQIARAFGDLHHTSVLAAVRKWQCGHRHGKGLGAP